jgi:hypothetical protein
MLIKVQTIENKAETFIDEVDRLFGDAAGPFKPPRAEGPIAVTLRDFSDGNISLAKLSKDMNGENHTSISQNWSREGTEVNPQGWVYDETVQVL